MVRLTNSLYKRFLLLFVLTLIAIVTVLGAFTWHLYRDQLRNEAVTLADHVIAFRRWVANSGVVWVDNLHPEFPDYLFETKAADGKTFYAKNPALATRELSSVYAKLSTGTSFKVTSDNLRNEKNRADRYELAAIKTFKSANPPKFVEQFEGTSYRYSQPLKVVKVCLKCHGDPADAPPALIDRYGAEKAFGYKIGDIRGIISISVPHRKLGLFELFSEIDILLTSAGLLLIVVFLYYWFRREISRPLGDLTDVTNVIASGDLDKGLHMLETLHAKQSKRNSGEIFQLTSALLDMDLDLKATTVSRDYSDSIFNLAAEAMLVLNRDIQILRVNDAFCRLISAERAVVEGLPLSEFLEFEVKDWKNGAFNNDGTGIGLESVRNTLVSKNEIKIPVLLSTNAIKLPDGQRVILCTAWDLRNRLSAEQALSESNQRFRAMIESARDGAIVADQEGMLVIANRCAGEMFGYQKNEMIGMPISRLVPPQFRKLFTSVGRRFLVASAPELKTDMTEMYGLTRDGHEFPMECSFSYWEEGGKYFFGGILRDITDRKESERILIESENRLNSAFDAIDEGVWEWNIQTGEVIFAPQWPRIFGCELSEIKPHIDAVAERLHPDDIELVKTRLKRHFSGEDEQYISEHRMLHKDGRWIWVLDRGRVIEWGESGKAVKMIGAELDISERKLLEERLVRTQKMEAVGQLTGGVAHDFNNILQVVLSSLELAKEGATDEVKNLIEISEVAAARGAKLTRQLLAFSRKLNLQPEYLDCNAMIEETVKLLRRTLGEKISIELDLAETLPLVHVDPDALDNALMNLAINSKAAMPSGGKLKISSYRVAYEKEVLRGAYRIESGEYVGIYVVDSGHGMTRHVMDHIFEPFFTTKDVGEGSGLGMSMVYGFVKQSNGFINIESESGKGTSIELLLPVVITDTKASKQQTEVPITTGKTGKVLLVEDDTSIREATSRVLAWLGFEITEAADADSAITLLESNGEFDLVVTDVVMPGQRSGFDLAEYLTKNQPNTRVLLMSGYHDAELQRTGMELSQFEFLRKPFSITELSSTLERLIGRTDENNQH